MYDVLIVDDEYYICEGIKKKLANLALPEVGEVRSCLSGEEALDLCRGWRPQIVITDIKMKGMDGIELIQRLAKKLYPVQFLVLSGYDDFSYVRGAFQSGAVDYLLKPLLTSDLLRMVKAACANLKNLPAKASSQRSDLFHLAARLLPPLAELSPKVAPSQEGKEGLASFFGEAGPLTAAALAFEGFQSRDERNLRANLIYDRFEGLCPLLCCPFRESQYLMLFGSGDEAALSAGLEELLQAEAFTDGHAVAASLSRCGTMEQAGGLLAEALRQLACRVKGGYGRLYLPKDFPTRKSGLPQKIKNLVTQTLQTPGLIVMEGVKAELSREIRAMPLLDLMCFCDYFNGMLSLELLDGVGGEQPPPFWDFGSYSEVEGYIFSRLKKYGECRDTCQKSSSLMDRVKQYVDQHFTESITLSELADRFFVSYSHLSKSFHKAFHMPFTEYVLTLRMERALQLLNQPELSIQDIAAQVGYDNLFNFSRAFKSFYGKAPSYFRKSQQT